MQKVLLNGKIGMTPFTLDFVGRKVQHGSMLSVSRGLAFVLLLQMSVVWGADAQEGNSPQAPARQDNPQARQTEDAERDARNKDFWIVSVGDSRSAVRLGSITSVSLHSYMLDGKIKIKELTIDTTGNNSLRFYGSDSTFVNEKLDRLRHTRALIDEKTENAARLPSRKFPEGVYSHNVEFQIQRAADLEAAYRSVLKAMTSGKGDTFRF